MAALSLTGGVKVAKNHAGSFSLLYIQSPKYSTACEKNLNQAAWKRGTGGRSSFNGIVATVFGCSGFVGRYVCNRLGKLGTQLILPHRCDHYDMMRLKVVGDLGQVLFHPEFNIYDQESIEQSIKYSNVVINLVGKDYETSNYSFDDVHVKGARNIAKACAKVGVDRLIHLSYLNCEEHPESPLLKNGSKFKRSKWLGEQAVKEEFPDVTILKASDIYGSEDRFLRSLSHWWRRQDRFMPMWDNGKNTFKQPVYVADVAQGIINLARDPETRGQVYQALGPKRYEMAELVDWLYRVMRKDKHWGFRRYNMKYDPIFQLKVTLNEKFSPGYPLGYLHWESLDREITTDKAIAGVPTLEDLGVTLTDMEHQVPWELHTLRAYSDYYDELGEFEKPAPPITVPLEFAKAQ